MSPLASADVAASPAESAACDRTPVELALRSPHLDGDAEAVLDGARPRSEPMSIPYTYALHVPADLRDGDVPLLVAMHGLGGSGPQFADQSTWADLADELGFIVAFPTGARRWDTTEGSPDVAFIRAVVAEIRAERCIDGRRIYATGHSYGGFMTQRLACDAGDLFAAGGVVSGGNVSTPGIGGPCDAGTGTGRLVTTPDGYEPVPLAFWHGTEDAIVRYENGRASFDAWLARYECEPPTTTAMPYGAAEESGACHRGDITSPRFAIRFRTYVDHAHGYPDGCGGLGAVSATDCTEPDASRWPTAQSHNREIIDFLFQHERTSPAP